VIRTPEPKETSPVAKVAAIEDKNEQAIQPPPEPRQETVSSQIVTTTNDQPDSQPPISLEEIAKKLNIQLPVDNQLGVTTQVASLPNANKKEDTITIVQSSLIASTTTSEKQPAPPAVEPAPKVEPDKTQTLVASLGEETKEEPSHEVLPEPDELAQYNYVSEPTREVVEAFEWKTEIENVERSALAHEGSATVKQSHWEKVSATSHWPTIVWETEQRKPKSVPLISNNTALLLAKLAGGAALQSQAGIVFGRIPKGWNVEFSGRAESLLTVNSDNQVMLTVFEERYFVFLNASPGAHLLFVSEHDGAKTQASVAIPVLEGTATYIDLTAPQTKRLAGRILDAHSTSAKGLAGVSVRVIGQPGKAARTNKQGDFKIENVITYSDIPVFIDVESKKDFTHRYRVSAASIGNLAVFMFKKGRILEMLSQLEGGISPESGMVIAAAPGVVAQYGSASIYPLVRTVHSSSSLVPETYTLSVDNRMNVDGALTNESSRFIAVQVPEGLNAALILDNQKRTLFSELLIASPGVINVLGPW